MHGSSNGPRSNWLESLILLAIAGPVRAVPQDGASGMKILRLASAGIRLSVGDADVFIDARNPGPGENGNVPHLESAAGKRFALVTHDHGGHLDLRALADVLGDRGHIVAHEDVANACDHARTRVRAVRTFEPVYLTPGGGEFVAWCVPGSDRRGRPQYSWIVDGGGRRVIHCGDTQWHGAWWDVARAFGPFDAAFVPVRSADLAPDRHGRAGDAMTMTPEQVAAATAVLQARIAVPVHYCNGPVGYFRRLDSEARFLRAAAGRGIDARIIAPGDYLAL